MNQETIELKIQIPAPPKYHEIIEPGGDISKADMKLIAVGVDKKAVVFVWEPINEFYEEFFPIAYAKPIERSGDDIRAFIKWMDDPHIMTPFSEADAAKRGWKHIKDILDGVLNGMNQSDAFRKKETLADRLNAKNEYEIPYGVNLSFYFHAIGRNRYIEKIPDELAIKENGTWYPAKLARADQ